MLRVASRITRLPSVSPIGFIQSTNRTYVHFTPKEKIIKGGVPAIINHRYFSTDPDTVKKHVVEKKSTTPGENEKKSTMHTKPKLKEETSFTKISGTKIIQSLYQYVWPDDRGLQLRVAGSLGLLVIAKLLNVQVPFLFKYVIDALNQPAVVVLPVGLLLSYGLAKSGAALFNELRNTIFAKVAQEAVREVSKKTFLHLHSMDLSYHLGRETGALSKIVDRGSRGITWVLNAIVFHMLPTIFEIVLVCSILTVSCGPSFAAITVATLTSYIVFTLAITQWRTKFRKQMNAMDNLAGSKVVDSLLNYETVKYYQNEKYEADCYEEFLKVYEKAALKTQSSLAILNVGQNFIFTAALTISMYLAATQVLDGTLTVGDLVMVPTTPFTFFFLFRIFLEFVKLIFLFPK